MHGRAWSTQFPDLTVGEKLEAYTDFASVYDLFMDNTPYEEWADRLAKLLNEYKQTVVPKGNAALASEAGLVVDLGCGTGTMTRLLADKGFDMIGVDSSFEMLEIARRKCAQEEKDILFLNQDMRELELFCTVGAVISVCDCVNYLLEEDELLETFRLVNNYLYPQGLFVFDFNTVHKYRDVIGDSTIAENREEGSFIWENFFSEEDDINEYDLTIYMKDSDGKYIRSEETHVQRGYECDTMKALVEKAGMTVVSIFDSDTNGEVTAQSERICIVARECGKTIPALG